METLATKQAYLERKRIAILNLGYDYIAFKSRAKKLVIQLKELIVNENKTF